MPDAALTVETRALLLRPASEVFGDSGAPDRAVVRDQAAWLIAAVGRAGTGPLLRATDGLRGRWDLIAPIAELDRLAGLLPGWRAEAAVIHELAGGAPTAYGGEPSAVELLSAPRPGLLDHLSGDLRRDLEQVLDRGGVAAAFVDGRPVSFCYSYLETESLWDVSVETLEGYRRRGLAAACAVRLIAHKMDRGRRPVWGALESNAASRGLARRLGFRPVGRLGVLEKTDAAGLKGNQQVT